MLFRLLFAAAVGDCYLNGPCRREEEKLVAIAISIVAILLNEQYAFILAELVWFAVFARAGWEAKPSSASQQLTVTTTVAVPAAPEKKSNGCPPILKSAIDESFEMFLKNREGPVSCDGEPWEQLVDSDGDKIWRAKYPGQNIYRWRAHSTLFGPQSGIVSELFDYTKRAGPNGWDKNLAKGRCHKEFDGGYKILIYSTNPVLAGLISPREFVEGRLVKPKEPGNIYIMAGVGLDEKIFGPALGSDFPVGDSKCTRAQAFPGGGMYIYPAVPGLDPETPQDWHYQLVVNTAIGGWVPTSTINSASRQVLEEAAKLQKSHMLSKFKKN